METETTLAKIDKGKQIIANIDDIKDARTMLSIANGLITAARKEYKATATIAESKEERNLALNTAIGAGILRLLAEAKLGELIQLEQEAGRLAVAGDNQYPRGSNNVVTTLKSYGLTRMDSSRAKQIYEHADLISEIEAEANKVAELPTRKDFERLLRQKYPPDRKQDITELPEGIFSVIYADPPWRYDFSKVEKWGIEEHYNTLNVEDIKYYKDEHGTPIQEKFADNAILFLWSPQPKIAEALEVVEAWGFNYTTGAVWVKDRIGMGYWWMQKHELLLLAKRGNFPPPATENRPPSVIESHWDGHSKKPQCIYEMIEKMCPIPATYLESTRNYYLECFARELNRPHWAGFGQEYSKNG